MISNISRYSPSKGQIKDAAEAAHISAILEDGKIPDINLPNDTVYLIDKVVRKRAREGPIGVDNSELINLEMEREFKDKNQHILNLAGGQIPEEEGEDGGINKENDQFLNRLTDAAVQA
jgi:hypothetical protein